jgi:hypothetical protein
MPVEIFEPLKRYEQQLAKDGIRMTKMDLIRNFSSNVILPHDNMSHVVNALNNASKKKGGLL